MKRTASSSSQHSILLKSLPFLGIAVIVIPLVVFISEHALHKQQQALATTPIYWGAITDESINTFEAHVGKNVSIIQFGKGWWFQNRYVPFNASDFESIRQSGSIPMIDWRSWDYTVVPEYQQPRFSLSSIIDGTHDTFIRSWAIAARQWGHPFFLRFDAEQNGNWYPWSELRNGNTAGQFVQAWRHVHDIFTQVGATNVTWVWCPNVDYPGAIPLAELYPGDRYVDWVAMDGYNYGTDPSRPTGWKSFYDLFAPTYNELQTLAPKKPLMIAETASTEDGGSKAAWITDALKVQLPTNFPKIKAFLWYNANDDNIGLVVETSASAQAAFASGIASAYYVSNSFGTITMSPIQAP
ncbi:MAG TPA: beta-mannanase [Ktedonobacter sp.]|nr:beta-mannanase [Ktedonobacter sp.]